MDGRGIRGAAGKDSIQSADSLPADTENMPEEIAEQVRDIVALMSRGRTADSAAKALGIHHNSLKSWLKKYPRAFSVAQRINIEGMAHRYRSHSLRLQERLIERSAGWVDTLGDIADNGEAPPGARVQAAKAGLGFVADFVSRRKQNRGTSHPEEIKELLRSVLPAMWDQPISNGASYVVEAKVTVNPNDESQVIDVTPEPIEEEPPVPRRADGRVELVKVGKIAPDKYLKPFWEDDGRAD